MLQEYFSLSLSLSLDPAFTVCVFSARSGDPIEIRQMKGETDSSLAGQQQQCLSFLVQRLKEGMVKVNSSRSLRSLQVGR